MTVDIDTYSANKRFIQEHFLAKYKDNPGRAVGSIAQITHVPCIVVAYYIGPVCDWHPDIIKTIKSLIDFYGYSEIKNKPEGAPL